MTQYQFLPLRWRWMYSERNGGVTKLESEVCLAKKFIMIRASSYGRFDWSNRRVFHHHCSIVFHSNTSSCINAEVKRFRFLTIILPPVVQIKDYYRMGPPFSLPSPAFCDRCGTWRRVARKATLTNMAWL